MASGWEGYKVPLLFDPETKKFRSFKDRMTELGFIYSTTSQAVGTPCLYKLAEFDPDESWNFPGRVG